MDTAMLIMVLWVAFVILLLVMDSRTVRRERDTWRTIAEAHQRRETVRRRVFKDYT